VSTAPSSHGWADSPEEEVILVIVGAVAFGAAAASAGSLWLMGASYLVDHGILVAAANHPLLAIPGADGAGLDLPRLAILAGAGLIGLAAAISAVRRSWFRHAEVV